MRRNISARTVVNFLSYLSLILIGVALTCVVVFKAGKFTNALHIVSESLAYLVVIITSFAYAKNKRNIVWLILWVLFSALVITMVVLVY